MAISFGLSAVVFAALAVNAQATLISSTGFEYCGKTTPMQLHPETGIPRISETTNKNMTLIQVQAIIRHGAPMEALDSQCECLKDVQWNCTQTMENRPTINQGPTQRSVKRLFNNVFLEGANTNPGNCQDGQLLDLGYYQHTHNGEAMYAAYVDPKKVPYHQRLDDKSVWLYSDNFERTEASGKVFFENMFPACQKASRTTKVVPWYQADKTFYQIYDFCSTEKCKNNTKQAQAEYEKINTTPNKDLTWCWWQAVCGDHPIAASEKEFNDINAKVTKQQMDLFEAPSPVNPELTNGAVFVAPLVNLVAYNMQKAELEGPANERRFVLWSAHDTLLMRFMSYLGIGQDKWVPYASVLLLELWKEPVTGKRSVRVIYNGKVMTLPYCHGQELCSYEDFNDFQSEQVEALKELGIELPVF